MTFVVTFKGTSSVLLRLVATVATAIAGDFRFGGKEPLPTPGHAKGVRRQWVLFASSCLCYPILNRSASISENHQSQAGTITNKGATSGITSTLPSASEGLHQTFIDNNPAYRIIVVPNTSDQIIWTDGTIVSSATGSIVSTARYNSFMCEAVDSATWVVTYATGTWSITT